VASGLMDLPTDRVADSSKSALTDGRPLALFVDDRGEAAEAAFATLVERHGPMVLRACRRVLRNAHDAEDALQASFLLLARKARSLRDRDTPAPWLYGAACNVSADARKAITRRAAAQRRMTDMARAWHAESKGPAAGAGELAAALHEEIAHLAEPQRTALVLCDLQQRSHAEVARLLGWPIGTVKSRQVRARERVRGRLERRGLGLSAFGLASPLRVEASGAVVTPAKLVGMGAAIAAVALLVAAGARISTPRGVDGPAPHAGPKGSLAGLRWRNPADDRRANSSDRPELVSPGRSNKKPPRIVEGRRTMIGTRSPPPRDRIVPPLGPSDRAREATRPPARPSARIHPAP